MRCWKIGELAREVGVTVRTLHHYDRIGLLRPSERSVSGYRLYTERDIIRLQQILSLRALGFSLPEAREFLAGYSGSVVDLLEMHLERLREGMAMQERLCGRLEALAAHLRASETPSADEFIRTMEMMTMLEKYYTPEQLKQLEERRRQVGEERIREVEGEWPRLMEEVRAEMEKGTDPSDPRVQGLTRRWKALVSEFTGGDPGITRSLENLYRSETKVRGMDTGPMREMGEYMSRAATHGGGEGE